jgi:polyhydroxyalkanoate synthase subunit PhaC
MGTMTLNGFSVAQAEENMRRLGKVLTTRARIAQTPKEQIWALNKSKLYRYVPVVPEADRKPVPLLLVFALMNRPYILDLRPGHSFVEFMVKEGYDVYLLDWGCPGPDDKDMDFGDYALDYLPRAIRKMKAVSGSEEFSMLGWCIGAILTTVYAAVYPNDGLKNLLLLTAPLDFSQKDSITFANWVDERYFDVEKVLGRFGNMPAGMIEYGAKALKPVENYLGSWMRLWDILDNPKAVEAWHAMNTWVTDNIPMPGGAFRQLIVDLYRNNRLMEGSWVLKGKPVDVSQIRANLLTVIAGDDHITPPCQSGSIHDRVGSTDKESYHIPGGHIGIMAGSQAAKRTWPHIDAWLAARSGARPKS